VRIQSAERKPGLIQAPPVTQGGLDHPSGPHHPVNREQCGNIPKRHVGCNQDDAQSGFAIARPFGRQHHGHIDVAGEMSQPLGMAGIRKACQVKGVFMGGGGNDGVHFAGQGHSSGGLDCSSRDPSGPHGAAAVGIRITGAEPPGADADVTRGGERGDLIFGPHHHDVSGDGLSQGTGGDLGAYPPRIAQRNRDARALTFMT
jgi:hypothetical protein